MRLGAGMGEVYRTQDSKLGRDVAIKVLPYEFARDPERLSRLRREARTLAWIEKGSPTRSFFVLSLATPWRTSLRWVLGSILVVGTTSADASELA